MGPDRTLSHLLLGTWLNLNVCWENNAVQGPNNPTVGSCLILTYSQGNSHHIPLKNPVKETSEPNFHIIQMFKGICTKNTIVGFSRHKQQWMNEWMNWLMNERCRCLPNDYIIFVDYVSQGAVFNGKAVAYDDTGSAFKAVDKSNTDTAAACYICQ